MKIFFFFLILLPSSLFAQIGERDLAHPFYLLSPGEFTIQTSAGYFMEEHEYERASVVQDLFEYEHRYYKLGAMLGLASTRQLGLEVSFQDRGELTKKYSPSLALPQENINYKGFHALEITYQEHLKTDNQKNKLAFEIKLRGSPLKGKDTNNTYQGKDFALNLLYSHLHNEEWRIYGNIHSQVIGKKKTYKSNNELEVVSPYSEFGSLLGIQWLQGKYWLDLNGYFYLTTDYNSSSPSYTRLTDKGFTVGGSLLFGYCLTNTMALTIEHAREGSNFNMITESTSEANEFEIETQYTQLGVKWLF